MSVGEGLDNAQSVIDLGVSAKLTNLNSLASINLVEGSVDDSSTPKDITMNVNAKVDENGAISGIIANVIPASVKKGTSLLSLTCGNTVYNLVIDSDMEFLSGVRNIVNVKINEADINIETVFSVSDWIVADDIDYDMDIDSGVETSVKDIDGNGYKIVKIKDYYWMAQNLRVTNYSDGTPIPLNNDSEAWQLLTDGAYCTYDQTNPAASEDHFFYNFHAVDTDKLCPIGWIVPSLEQYNALAAVYGGNLVAGLALKSTYGWDDKTVEISGNGTNVAELNFKPVGVMEDLPKHIGKYIYLWTTTPQIDPVAKPNSYYSMHLYYGYDKFTNWAWASSKKTGMSVRCIKPANLN